MSSDALRLVYVDGPWAYFVEFPDDAWGDDWNDAPHDCNAGVPYYDRSGAHLTVAYDGDLEVAGTQFGSFPPFHPPEGFSVEEINAGVAPWLYQPSYGLKWFPAPTMTVPAKVTLAEFTKRVAMAGGRVYR